MPPLMVSDKFSICHHTCKNPIRRCRRHPAQLSHIGVHDIVVSFKILLNLVPAECGLIQFSIAHFINQNDKNCSEAIGGAIYSGAQMSYTPKMKIRHYGAQTFDQKYHSPVLPLRSHPRQTRIKYENSTVRKGGFYISNSIFIRRLSVCSMIFKSTNSPWTFMIPA